MAIYTRGGDKGETGLFGGKRVSKNSPRIQAYGDVDELDSFIGLALSKMNHDDITEDLMKIQKDLYRLMSELANPQEAPNINENNVSRLERICDAYDNECTPLKHFIVMGGSPTASRLHVCRTVCRRAERSLVELDKIENVNPESIAYMNRLSTVFFVLGRAVNNRDGYEERKFESL